MPLSLGKENENATSDDVEQRLRNRLADLEGRLEDQQKVRQMREHIQHLRNKHQLELKEAKLDADQRVEEVKRKARTAVEKAKNRIENERQRNQALKNAIQDLAEALHETGKTRRTLEDAGLEPRLVLDAPPTSADEDPHAFLRDVTARQRDIEARLDRLLTALDGGELDEATADVSVLEDRLQDLLTNPEVRSQAQTVAEKARMFAEDPGKSQYHRELLAPYARGIQALVEDHQRANVVQGARLALRIVEEAFSDSRTYLLRRSSDLDGHEIPVDVLTERVEEDPADAVDRLEAVLSSARGLGPVDFFQNLTNESKRRLDRREDGAGVAAWVLSDVTVAVLEDEAVRSWLSGQR